MCKCASLWISLGSKIEAPAVFFTVCCAHEALRTLHLSRDEGQARRRRLGLGKSSFRAEFGQFFWAGLDPSNEHFWKRALHALCHDSAWSSGMTARFRSACVNLGGRFEEVMRVKVQEACTKSWDDRAMDALESYRNRGIVHKIAHSTEADFEKCIWIVYS